MMRQLSFQRCDSVELNRVLDKLKSDLNPAIADLTWKTFGVVGTIPLQNGWISFDSGSNFYDPQYTIDGITNRFYLRGAVKLGTVGATPFTLPPGLRPRRRLIFITLGSAAGPTDIALRIDVLANGTLVTSGVGGAQSNNYMFLDGISFIAEQ